MKKQAVLRKTLTGAWTTFEFEQPSDAFFVKNFSDGDIFVSFKNSDVDDQSVKIRVNTGEEVSITRSTKNFVTSIYVKGTGEVEVEALDAYVEYEEKIPVATIDGVDYYHALETTNLSWDNPYYSLAGEALSTQPSEYPYIAKENMNGTKYLCLKSGGSLSVTVKKTETTSPYKKTFVPTTDTATYDPVGEKINAEYFSAGVFVIENDTQTFYYNLAGE